ncbi:MAG: hypothetical protein SOW44_01400 [Porphyromonas sp.]|nr:hypothetical protein [Bacteroidales bacterium]MDY3099989.1 hypothetical protein [Porphyromonas sp.]
MITRTEANDLAGTIVSLINKSDRFREELGKELIQVLARQKRYISQRQAYKFFGRTNVDRWVSKGVITPLKRGERKLEYNMNSLITIAEKEI